METTSYQVVMSRQTNLFEELRNIVREEGQGRRLDLLHEWWRRHVTTLTCQTQHDRLSLRCIKDPASLKEWTWADIANQTGKALLTDMLAERSVDRNPDTGDETQSLSVLVLR